jgi:hypothetical protein
MTPILDQSSRLAARRAIESLRSGVPSRLAVSHLGTTQDVLQRMFEQRLAAVEAGEGVQPLMIGASFGKGKTHLLEYLQALAGAKGFTTAYLVVSPELPLGNAHAVLKALAEAAIAPGRVGKALRALSDELNTSSPAFAQLREWAGSSGINERFCALLHLYQDFRADEDLRCHILDDLEGKALNKSVITQKLKEIKEHKTYTLGRMPKTAALAPDRIRLLARVFRAAGCKGLVVMFDELERMARFSFKQRVAAYEQIGWWNEVAGQADAALLPVFTMSSGFLQETVTGRTDDAKKIGVASLSNSREPHERRLYAGIELLKSYRDLEPISEGQEDEIRQRLRDLYERSYGVTLDHFPVERSDIDLPIRSMIRRWITQWDLRRYDPQYCPEVGVEEVPFATEEIVEAMAWDEEADA